MPLSGAVRVRRRTGLMSVTNVFLLLLISLSAARGQSTSSDPTAKYQQAVAETQTNRRILALEEYVSARPGGSLQVDALELLVWGYKQIGNQQKASSWAQKLIERDAENPLGLAVLADSARYHEGSSLDQNMANSLSLAKHGLRQIDYIKPPEGISAREFSDLQGATRAWLNGAAGFAYVHLQDYVTARTYLRKAATLQPENPQYVYELALADLHGKQPESQEGFTYLAKAVNLTQGTPAGQQIAAYAANRYLRAGGSAQNWKQYLLATAPPGTTVASASTTPPAVASEVAKNEPAGAPQSQLPQSSESTPPPQSPQSSVSRQTPQPPAETDKNVKTHISEEQIEATLRPPPLPPTQTAPKPVSHPGGPVSLGILMEASISNRENRRTVTYALTDLVRHLRQNDEAFILSFSHDLVFEQDLTSNYEYLRDAVESIKPQSGTALLDAVGFASGHLNRISRKGTNRVLLVVSDGNDINSRTSPYEVTGAIDSSGVKIYCIGVGIDNPSNRSRLQALAARSGGRATFVRPENFRAAAHEIAQGMGIDFPQ